MFWVANHLQNICNHTCLHKIWRECKNVCAETQSPETTFITVVSISLQKAHPDHLTVLLHRSDGWEASRNLCILHFSHILHYLCNVRYGWKCEIYGLSIQLSWYRNTSSQHNWQQWVERSTDNIMNLLIYTLISWWKLLPGKKPIILQTGGSSWNNLALNLNQKDWQQSHVLFPYQCVDAQMRHTQNSDQKVYTVTDKTEITTTEGKLIKSWSEFSSVDNYPAHPPPPSQPKSIAW